MLVPPLEEDFGGEGHQSSEPIVKEYLVALYGSHDYCFDTNVILGGGIMVQEISLPESKEELIQVASVLQAISHPTRMKILCYLSEQERIVNDILEHTGTTQSNISQHIDVLRKAGVVKSRRSHNKVYCSLQTEEMMPLIGQIKKIFCAESEKSNLVFT